MLDGCCGDLRMEQFTVSFVRLFVIGRRDTKTKDF